MIFVSSLDIYDSEAETQATFQMNHHRTERI